MLIVSPFVGNLNIRFTPTTYNQPRVLQQQAAVSREDAPKLGANSGISFARWLDLRRQMVC